MRKAFRPEILALLALLVLVVLAVFVLPLSTTTRVRSGLGPPRCKPNLKQLGLAIGMYMIDYNEVMPPSLQILTDERYVKFNEDRNIFVCPVTPRSVPFDPNAIDATTDYCYVPLKKPVNIETASSVPIVWDKAPHSDGAISVLYLDLDLHVDTVTLVDLKKAITSMRSLYIQPSVLPAPPAVTEEKTVAPSPEK